MTRPPDGGFRWEGRRRAREAALRMLYQTEVGQLSVSDAAHVLSTIGEEEAIELDDEGRAYAVALAHGTAENSATLDGHIADAAHNWRVERLGLVERLLLRLALRELTAHPDTPPRVVIDEAIELARSYGGEEAARFVNGVLDGVFKKLKSEGSISE